MSLLPSWTNMCRLCEPSDFTFRFRDLFSCRIAISDYCSLLHACTAAVSCLLSSSHQASALTGILLRNGDYVFFLPSPWSCWSYVTISGSSCTRSHSHLILVGDQGTGAETKAPSRTSLRHSLLDGEMDVAANLRCAQHLRSCARCIPCACFCKGDPPLNLVFLLQFGFVISFVELSRRLQRKYRQQPLPAE